MLGFNARWDRKRFASRIAISITGYIAASTAFPFGLMAFAAATNCSSISGACGVTGLLFSMIVKPLVYGLFILSIIPALTGRLRDVGVSPWLSLFVLLLIFADNAFLVYAGAPWSFGFTAGVIQIQQPVFALAAFALIVALAIIPPRDGKIALRGLGWPGWLAVATAGPVVIAATNRLVWSFPSLLSAIRPLTSLIYPLVQVGHYALFVLPIVTAFALWPRPGEVIHVAPTPAPGSRVPLLPLGAVSLGLAAALTLVISPSGLGLMALMMLPAVMMSLILPNAVLFFALLFTVYLWLTRPSWVPALLSVLLIATYSSWGYQHYLKAHLAEIDERELAAVETYRPDTMPRAILVDVPFPATSDELRVMLERNDMEIIAVKTKTGFVGYRNARPDEAVVNSDVGLPNRRIEYEIPSLPNPHLVLKTWSISSFYSGSHPGGQYAGDSPYELRIVDGASDRLVAVWYRRLMQAPYWLPILTSNGWKEADGGYGPRMDEEEAMRGFLATALGNGHNLDPTDTK